MSDVSVPEETAELHTRSDFDSDAITVSDVGEETDEDFSQWTDSMEALVASFDVTAGNSTPAAVTAGADARRRRTSYGALETISASDSADTTPPNRSRPGNSALSSPAKRRLESTADNLQEPPSTRPRKLAAEAVTDPQTEMSPLRKTLSSALSLRTS